LSFSSDSLPLVNSALTSAYSLYDASKHRLPVLDTLETSIKERVVPQFTPLVTQLHAYDAQWAHVDAVACSGLDLLERQLPILREPTDRVLASGRRILGAPVHTVSDSVARSWATATHAVEARVPPLTGLVESAIVFSEHAVDRILPETAPASATHTNSATDTTTTTNGAAAAAEAQAKAPVAESPMTRAHKLGDTVRRRLVHRVAAATAVSAPASATSTSTTTTTTALTTVQVRCTRVSLALVVTD
jgi:hypothetical protein